MAEIKEKFRFKLGMLSEEDVIAVCTNTKCKYWLIDRGCNLKTVILDNNGCCVYAADTHKEQEIYNKQETIMPNLRKGNECCGECKYVGYFEDGGCLCKKYNTHSGWDKVCDDFVSKGDDE